MAYRGAMRVVIVGLTWLAMVGCTDRRDNEDAILCRDDDGCGAGRCLPAPISGLPYCADPAPGCASGLRWALTAGDELAGTCVTGAAAIARSR